MKSKKTMPMWRGFPALFISLFGATISLYGVATTWRGTVDTLLQTSSYRSTNDSKFVSDYSSTDELIEAHEKIGEKVGAEGSVLLKNINNALPLTSENPKVTLLGMGSMYPIQGGTMGSTSEGKVNLVSALTEKGFSVNPTMTNIYTTLGSVQTGEQPGAWPGAPSTPIYGYRPNTTVSATYSPSEPNISVYTSNTGAENNWQDSFEEYSDAAIVVISRPGTEGTDYAIGEGGVDASTGATSALGLCDNERALIELAKEKFDKVIVLINSGSVMEIEELKQDSGVDAIMFVGFPGDYGFLGIASVLKGDVSPSGHLSDTFAVDNSKSPAAQNFGRVGKIADTSEIVVSDSLMGNLSPETSESTFVNTPTMAASQYIIEAEGIYTGYKYYETRYYDSIMNPNSNASSPTSDKRDLSDSSSTSWSYDDEVSYPFGYGLSYTTFTQTLDSIRIDMSAKTVTASVTVTNTGNVAGKDSIQLYVQSPYTNYDIEHNVEKSAVNFIGMEKTELLNPNDSKTYTITVELQYIASYDSTAKDGLGGYILDGGDYYFAIGDDSHAAVNNIIVSQGNTSLTGNTDQVKAASIGTEGEVDEETFAKSKNGVDVVNQLENADINYYKPGYATYLSRSDWSGTFPRTYDDLEVSSDSSEHFDEWIHNLANETYKVRTEDNVNLNGSGGTLTLNDVAGETDVDSDYWQKLVDQIPAEKVYTTILRGGSSTDEIAEIDSPKIYQNDGPNGFGSNLLGRNNKNEGDPNKDYVLNTMSNLVLIGCTFDQDIAREWGELMGNDGLWTDNYLIWGAAANIHRTAFSGRNFEYYSEDPMLSNYMLKETSLGALDYGVIIGPKHFAFNDQESYRGGIAPYMTEQKAREGDLRAFQGSLENGSLGVMTSFSRIGATAVHGSVNLIQNILRGEWDYNGLITTDMASNLGYFRAEAMINAGITMVADFAQDETFAQVTESWSYFTEDLIKGDQQLLDKARDNLKYQLYAFANSAVANFSTYRVMPWWEIAAISAIAVTGVLSVGSLAMLIVVNLKNQRREEENNA